MLITMNDNLRDAALQGRTDLLYAVIEADPCVLDNIDKIPFVETPLHLAASVGHISFATEIMRLKPSFAWKPNKQGLCPMHLAVENRQDRMVHRFVNIDENLIRIKGRDGFTPLHMTCKAGQIDLLAKFLLVCPKSIQDVTIQNENALHVAVKSDQFQVVDFLVRWLQFNSDRDADDLQKSTLNRQDELGNTILHILVGLNYPNPEIVKLLLRCKIDLNSKNFDGLTALDIVESSNPNSIVRNILVSARALRGNSVKSPRLVESLPSNLTLLQNIAITFLRIRINISDDHRNALLGAAAIVVTLTFQASQNPPGGVFQVDSEKGPLIRNSTNTTAKIYAGKTVMNDGDFTTFLMTNTWTLLLSILAILVLLPHENMVIGLVWLPVLYFGLIYFKSMSIISPPNFVWTELGGYLVLLFLLLIVAVVILVRLRSRGLISYFRLKKKMIRKSRFSSINL